MIRVTFPDSIYNRRINFTAPIGVLHLRDQNNNPIAITGTSQALKAAESESQEDLHAVHYRTNCRLTATLPGDNPELTQLLISYRSNKSQNNLIHTSSDLDKPNEPLKIFNTTVKPRFKVFRP